jgi:hypothetical protein
VEQLRVADFRLSEPTVAHGKSKSIRQKRKKTAGLARQHFRLEPLAAGCFGGSVLIMDAEIQKPQLLISSKTVGCSADKASRVLEILEKWRGKSGFMDLGFPPEGTAADSHRSDSPSPSERN